MYYRYQVCTSRQHLPPFKRGGMLSFFFLATGGMYPRNRGVTLSKGGDAARFFLATRGMCPRNRGVTPFGGGVLSVFFWPPGACTRVTVASPSPKGVVLSVC